jgi:hypothetical protein
VDGFDGGGGFSFSLWDGGDGWVFEARCCCWDFTVPKFERIKSARREEIDEDSSWIVSRVAGLMMEW